MTKGLVSHPLPVLPISQFNLSFKELLFVGKKNVRIWLPFFSLFFFLVLQMPLFGSQPSLVQPLCHIDTPTVPFLYFWYFSTTPPQQQINH